VKPPKAVAIQLALKASKLQWKNLKSHAGHGPTLSFRRRGCDHLVVCQKAIRMSFQAYHVIVAGGTGSIRVISDGGGVNPATACRGPGPGLERKEQIS
jgi:hypothetical protein